MASFYSGQDGKLFVDGNDTESAKVRSWSFTASQAVLETVSLGDTDRTLVPGLRSLTGSCSIYYYQTSPGSGTPTGGVSDFVSKFIKDGDNAGGDAVNAKSDSIRLKLAIDDGTSSMRYIVFYAYITSLAMTNAVGQIVSADISFEGHGAPTGIRL